MRIGNIAAGTLRRMPVNVADDFSHMLEIVVRVMPDKAIPIHYNDYDVFKSPLEDFKRAAEAAGLNDKMIYLAHGETHNFDIPGSRRKISGV